MALSGFSCIYGSSDESAFRGLVAYGSSDESDFSKEENITALMDSVKNSESTTTETSL